MRELSMRMRSPIVLFVAVLLHAQPPAGSYRARTFQVKASPTSETIQGASVTPTFFDKAKVRPLLGRLFLAEEYRARAPYVLVLSDRLWRRRFGGDPACLGKTVQVNGQNLTIVGVMPSTFDTPPCADL